jgi:hypothetical protein
MHNNERLRQNTHLRGNVRFCALPTNNEFCRRRYNLNPIQAAYHIATPRLEAFYPLIKRPDMAFPLV